MSPKKLAKGRLSAQAAVAKPAQRGRAAAARRQPSGQQPRGRNVRGRAARVSSSESEERSRDEAAGLRQIEQLIAALSTLFRRLHPTRPAALRARIPHRLHALALPRPTQIIFCHPLRAGDLNLWSAGDKRMCRKAMAIK